MALGKHLGYDFGKDRILHVHRGLQGAFTEGSGPLPEVRGALRLRMWNAAAVKKPAGDRMGSKPHRWYSEEDDGTDNLAPEKIAWVELRGPMDCSIYSGEMWGRLLERLGPDPLNGDGARKFVERVEKSRKTIGELLMDQSVAAGVGVILRAELLPGAAESVYSGSRGRGWYAAVDMEGCGCADEGGDGRPSDCDRRGRRTVRTRKGQALKEEAHYVYRRQGRPCFVSGTKILTRVMAGRNLFWCPVCQVTAQEI